MMKSLNFEKLSDDFFSVIFLYCSTVSLIVSFFRFSILFLVFIRVRDIPLGSWGNALSKATNQAIED
ncbi:hypothetical protein BJL96_28925 [Burkholderia cenocepacia]|nr:hypothetical protein [Burkholderia cenocepacia]